MTILQQESATFVDTTSEQRAQRLDAAGAAWEQRIAADPDNATLTTRVSGRAVGSVATEIRAGKHRFLVDEPAGLAGDDAAPSPVEYALGALISCQVVVFRLYAQALGLTIDELEITAEGDLNVKKIFGIDESVRAGFSGVRVTVDITGPHTAEEFEKLRAVVEEHCPVHDIFANAVQTTGSLR